MKVTHEPAIDPRFTALNNVALAPHHASGTVETRKAMGQLVRDNLAGIDRTTTGRLVPFCLFTDPELARVGLNESEAQNRGIAYRLAKIPATAILRTRTLSEPRGFYKALIAADSDRILRFTEFAPEANAVMTIVQVAIATGSTSRPCAASSHGCGSASERTHPRQPRSGVGG